MRHLDELLLEDLQYKLAKNRVWGSENMIPVDSKRYAQVTGAELDVEYIQIRVGDVLHFLARDTYGLVTYVHPEDKEIIILPESSTSPNQIVQCINQFEYIRGHTTKEIYQNICRGRVYATIWGDGQTGWDIVDYKPSWVDKIGAVQLTDARILKMKLCNEQ